MAGAVIRISGEFDDAALTKAQAALKKFGLNVDEVSTKSTSGFDTISTKAVAIGSAIGNAFGNLATDAVYKLGQAFVGGFKDAAEYQQLAAKTAAVIESTGNAANISVKGIQGLASSLESLSGVDENLIINGQNVLATFTNVRNEAGKGNDIFDQATKAALNMSVAMGSDLQGANVQLGKALNDPIKGITALSRVGVSFTEQQKKQIAALVQSGDTMGAQKIILAELNKEFGGAAEAAGSGFAGAMARAKDAVSDAFRGLATALLPVLTKLAEIFVNNVMPALQQGASAFMDFMRPIIESLLPVLKTVGGVLQDLAARLFPPLFEIFKAIGGYYLAVFKGVLEGIQTGWAFIADALKKNEQPLQTATNFFGKLVDILGTVLKPILNWLGTFVGTVLKVAFATLGFAISVVIGFIGDVIKVANAFGTALGDLKDGAMNAFNSIKGFIGDLWDKFIGFKNQVADIAKTIFSPILDGWKNIINGIIRAWNGIDFGIHITVPDWVPLVGGKGFNVDDIFPDIPYLAKGGIVTGPTLAMIGEAGPEAVIPLSRAGAGVGGVTIQSGAVQIVVNGNADQSAIDSIERVVQNALVKLAREVRYA